MKVKTLSVLLASGVILGACAQDNNGDEKESSQGKT